MVRWLRLTLDLTRANSEALVRADPPDVTPYDLLPTAQQRITAVQHWETDYAHCIGRLWDAQVARMLALAGALAALAVCVSLSWPTFVWLLLGLFSLLPLSKITQLRDQRTQALAALASRRDLLIAKINDPSA